jgi:GNAT superfamily N-acetyltransferase
MTFPQLDLALARRIELAEAQAAVDGAKICCDLKPALGAAVEPVAGGYAVYCGADSPITQAVGLGLNGPVSELEFAHLQGFYFTRREAVRVETCPLADASLIEHFSAHGYRVAEFSNVMMLPLNRSDSWPAAPEVQIEKVAAEHIELWTLTVAQGFSEDYPVTQEILDVMKMFALAPASECYLARIDGKVAGGATLAVRDGIAGLFGASTLPAFRNRGVQTALLRARLCRAAQEGCDIAVSLARPASISQHNIVRQDFRVLYTRVKFERAWKS